MTLTELVVETTVRSLVLASFCGCATWLLRSKTAALRFLIWKWTLLALFAMPVLMSITPSVLRPAQVLVPLPAAAILYTLITLLLLGRVTYSLTRLHKLAGRGEVIRHPRLRELAHEIWLDSGAFIRPRVAASKDFRSPVTFEAEETYILMPPSWPGWDEPKLRAVLTHEMAHVRRGDAQTLLLANLATCVFWFNPLSWFLRRQLILLAEETCDEIVLSSGSTPEQYADVLIDFARDVQHGHGVISGAFAVSGTSPLKSRIERLFVDTSRMQSGRQVLAAALLALFFPLLYLTAAVRPDPLLGQVQNQTVWPQNAASAEEISALQSAVQKDPENQYARMKLLLYFAQNRQEEPFTSQMLWFIHNHPDLDTLPMARGLYRSRQRISDASLRQMADAWEQAMAVHPGSSAVLFNAAYGLEAIAPLRSLGLLRQLEKSNPAGAEQYETQIGLLYAIAEMHAVNPAALLIGVHWTDSEDTKLREDFTASADAALMVRVGQMLVKLSSQPNTEASSRRGLNLIRQAITVDPANPKWKEALDAAEAEPQRREALQSIHADIPPDPGIIRIGEKIAEASLVTKVDPVYPSYARDAKIEGTVEFTAIIGTNGKVESLKLVRGQPLLINAAREAVLQYVYQPAFVDGKAVQFQTQIHVRFQLE